MQHAGKKVKMECTKVASMKDTMYVNTVTLYAGP